MTLISRGVPARAEGAVVYPVTNVNDSSYSTEYRCTPGCAAELDISAVPSDQRQTVVLSWYSDATTFQHVAENVGAYNEPRDLTIDVNTAAGGGSAPTTGWKTLRAVTGNVYNAGQYVLNLGGANWIRMRVTAVNGSPENQDASWQMDVASASSGATDTWLFLGDSITNNSMSHREPTNWIQAINAAKPSQWPSQVNGGMSSWLTSTFLNTDPKTGQPYITDFLTAFPDAHYVTINLGSNDVGGGVPGATVLAHMTTLVQDVIKAGRVPIVPTIPWAPAVCNANLANDNPATSGTANYDIVHDLYPAFPTLVHGPDLWTYFHENPSLISTSGAPGCPHPTSPTGENDYRALWARTMLAEVYR